MVDYSFLELGSYYLSGIMLPGPSMALVIRNSIIHSRQSGMFCSFGIVLGIALQAGLVLIGVFYISHNILNLLKVAGGIFLIYLGISSLNPKNVDGNFYFDSSVKYLNKKKYRFLLEGMLIELFNPIAFTFFISFIVNIVNESTTVFIKWLYWLEVIVLGFIWFSIVSLLSSIRKIDSMTKKHNCIRVFLGFVLVIIGCKILIWDL